MSVFDRPCARCGHAPSDHAYGAGGYCVGCCVIDDAPPELVTCEGYS